ncbi:hypothetical protein PSU4_26600 [Pseudonocardia sulfidoxydans NBRC 16205]|uniref:Carboxymuconolactone decarboxylase-like domain-containing protein n=1 Tax=Pseudonocardia sulfidoxydans NBRC 16205 TaxID=1223511 RepID=A0A511DFZ1_9PSEU|nr:hypothetical protein [Pseudonocardia sulfidoxydans]GEL23706.1 hypothetical protein PSU4_26600 [Pseudonocardia sulfidoxydans NBRC 16205]
MPTRVTPLKPGESSDPKVNEILTDVQQGGWWADPAMFGTIARRPEALKAIVPVFESFFLNGLIEPHIFEMMRLKTGQINDCAYCQAVRTQSVYDTVASKEEALFQRQPEASEVLTEREATAISFAERIALDPHTVDDAFWKRLTGVFSDDEVVELLFACGIFNWGNKFNITMQMDAAENSPYEAGMEYREEALA